MAAGQKEWSRAFEHFKQTDESRQVAMIRDIVDDVCDRIQNGLVDKAAARELTASVRFQVGWIIPDQMELYDTIYGSRFERLIRQFIRGES